MVIIMKMTKKIIIFSTLQPLKGISNGIDFIVMLAQVLKLKRLSSST